MARTQPNQLTVEDLLARIETLEDRLSRRQRGPRSRFLRKLPMAVTAAVLAIAVSGVTFASIPEAPGAIHGCKEKNGTLRIASKCASGETAVTWNKKGPKGDTGPPGPPGSAASAWSLMGNAGTVPGTNFLGTTDNEPFILKTNGTEALRIDPTGNVGIGVTGPIGRVEASAGGSSHIALLGTGDDTSSGRAIVGRLGSTTSCPGAPYAVGGCAATAGGDGVLGSSPSGTGVLGTGGIGVKGSGPNGIGVLGDSNARGVVGTLGGSSCPGSYAVGACAGSATADGLVARTDVAANGPTAAAVHAFNDAGGDLFIGEASGSRVARIDGSGKGFFDNGTQSGGADYAESMRAEGAAILHPGDVLAIDPRHSNRVRLSSTPSSPLVLGVFSTRPSVLAVGTHRLGDSLAGEVPVALLGVVPTKVTAQNGPIRAGDLLTTSSRPGYAMRAPHIVVGGVTIYATGTILGKALTSLKGRQGVIQVLLMSR
jgi:hypothetical protein